MRAQDENRNGRPCLDFSKQPLRARASGWAKKQSAPIGAEKHYVARFARKMQDVPNEIHALRSTHAIRSHPSSIHLTPALVRRGVPARPFRLADGFVRRKP